MINPGNHYKDLVQEFEQKLNRPLNKKEIDFIKWVVKKQIEKPDVTPFHSLSNIK